MATTIQAMPYVMVRTSQELRFIIERRDNFRVFKTAQTGLTPTAYHHRAGSPSGMTQT
jgi:hypothetical protein